MDCYEKFIYFCYTLSFIKTAENNNSPAVRSAYSEVFTEENIKQIRIPKFEKRMHNDDWFFSRCQLEL